MTRCSSVWAPCGHGSADVWPVGVSPTLAFSLFLQWGQLQRVPSAAVRVSAGSVVRWCAVGGSCCDEEGRAGQGSEGSGPCTEARGCSARTTGTWPPRSAASPPSSGQRSPSPGSRSPGEQREPFIRNISVFTAGLDDTSGTSLQRLISFG